MQFPEASFGCASASRTLLDVPFFLQSFSQIPADKAARVTFGSYKACAALEHGSLRMHLEADP
ncbi:protein of unknown function [Pseudomonas sp. JV241A]|nr:protein of unknown function [Pseudomonas sp. JV241A]